MSELNDWILGLSPLGLLLFFVLCAQVGWLIALHTVNWKLPRLFARKPAPEPIARDWSQVLGRISPETRREVMEGIRRVSAASCFTLEQVNEALRSMCCASPTTPPVEPRDPAGDPQRP